MLRPHVLRRPAGDARHLRRVRRRGGAHRCPPGEAGPEHRARHRGRGHQEHRARGHVLDDLLLPLPRGPDLRHARPPLGRTGGLERGDVGERRRGAELRPQGAPRTRRALRPGRRVPRGDDRALGQLGRRRAGARPGDAALRPPRQGARTQLRGGLVRRARPVDGAPDPAGTARAHAGGVVGPGSRVRRQVGGTDLHRRSGHRHRPRALQGPEGEDRRARAGPGLHQDVPDGLHGRRGVQGPRRGARAAVPERPRRPDGLAHLALRADELRLLRPVARRAHHRRADRVRVGHPRARCRTSRRTSAATR